MWDINQWSYDNGVIPSEVKVTSVYHERIFNSIFITGFIDGTKKCFTIQIHDLKLVTTWY